MQSTHTAHLHLQNLPPIATHTDLFPALGETNLLSISKLCDAGCTATFNATEATIKKNGHKILQGTRAQTGAKLWHIDLPQTSHFAGLAVNQSTKPADLVAFSHAAMFSPTITTLAEALRKDYLIGFPGLTKETLARHPPQSMATIKGHLDQSRTKQKRNKAAPINPTPNPSDPDEDLDNSVFPQSDDPNIRTHHCYAATVEISGQVYGDQTGKFTIPSSRGNKYTFCLYDYDSNYIDSEPIKNREAQSIVEAYKACFARLKQAGLTPKLCRLDNECSASLKQYFQDENVEFQLAPPYIHRRNAAERAIRTFKNHFIAGLASTDKDFPLHLWDRLIPQALLTLNLLRGSRINPRLSAHAQVHGQYNFNSHPIGPPGTKVLVHEKSKNRSSWAPHATESWYIGPSLEHYRCYITYNTETNSTRIADTLTWFPTKVPFPFPNDSERLTAALQDIANIVDNNQPNEATTLTNESQTSELQRLITIFRPNSNPDPSPSTHINLNTDQTPQRPLYATDNTSPTGRVTRSMAKTAQNTTPPWQTAALHASYAHTNNVLNTPLLRVAQKTPDNGTKGRFVQATACLAQEASTPILHMGNSNWTETCYKAIHPDTGDAVEYKQLLDSSDGHLWTECCAEEIGRLAQGYKCTIGTNTIHFIRINDIPPGRKATYLRLVVADRPNKENTRRVRFTVGGDKVEYPGDVSTKTAGLITAKILINSVISTPDARFCAFDIKDFYLNTPMERYEYMRIPIHQIPQTIFEQYNLQEMVHNDHVYVEIRKGMYGLPQAGILANKKLLPHLAKHGYHPCPNTHGLFTHETRPIAFSLIVDDFGVKYVGKQHAEHLFAALQEEYSVTANWKGDTFLGMKLQWDYEANTVDLSMPGYVQKALQQFQPVPPHKAEHSPHRHVEPQYGATTQLTEPIDDSEPLNKAETKQLQKIIGTFFYYARAVDNTMLVALGSLAAAQAKGTQQTAIACTKLLNYAATHPDAVIRYKASDMILHIHSDASYLSESQARSRVGGFFFLGTNSKEPPINGAIHVVSQIMTNVMASAAEAEVGGLFINGQAACPIRTTLEELGHPQPPTIIITDNECALGIANDTVKQRRSKAIDMRFYWIKDRVAQGQFTIYWKRGVDNLADYFTKHHPPAHHQRMRPRYIQQTDHGHNNGTANMVRFENSNSELCEPHENRIHCEGVLNNTAHTAVPHYPNNPSVPNFPCTQADPNDVAVDLPPCSEARLTNCSYWPITASMMQSLVSSSSS
jgi:Reverse transcriptase (RNA-dependent DNA polymerase)